MEAFEAMDEVELVGQAVAGSREAFARLVRFHQAAVRWYLVRCVRDPAAADDLAQEVFLCAYQNLATFRSAGSLRGWLIGIARNMAIQHVRTEVRRRRKERGPLSARLSQWRIEQLAQDPGDGEDQERTFEALQACIEQLAPESRRVVDEHYFQRRTMESIAQRQGRGAGAVRMMLLRIRQALGECIRNKLRNPR